jgi:hypothetical protein
MTTQENNFTDNDIFSIKESDVQHLAKCKYGRCLDEDEIIEVKKRIEWGFTFWDQVVISAIDDVIGEINK